MSYVANIFCKHNCLIPLYIHRFMHKVNVVGRRHSNYSLQLTFIIFTKLYSATAMFCSACTVFSELVNEQIVYRIDKKHR